MINPTNTNNEGDNMDKTDAQANTNTTDTQEGAAPDAAAPSPSSSPSPILKCPKCGNEDVDLMRYHARVYEYRSMEVTGENSINIYGDSDWSDAEDEMIVCRKWNDDEKWHCNAQIPVEDGIEWEFDADNWSDSDEDECEG